MLQLSSPNKRDRGEDLVDQGPPQKVMGVATGGCEDSDAPVVRMGVATGGCEDSDAPVVRASASYNNKPSTSKVSPDAPAGQIENVPSKVLLFTVCEPKYPITVDIIHKVCTTTGANVERIVIFRKHGVQAMVEFDSVESATTVKDILHDAEIYSGCCKLKIAWGKPTHLNVAKNDHDNCDYTLGNQDKDTSAKSQALLPDPIIGDLGEGLQRREPSQLSGEYRHDTYPGQAETSDSYRRMPPGGKRPQVDMIDHENGGRAPKQQPPAALPAGFNDGSGSMLQQGSVLMVYGLNKDRMNCQRVFNLFCLYGNVVRVKFLKSKDGVAMVQLGDNASCDRALKNINGCFVLGHKMLMGYSKQAFIQDVPNPVNLPDGTVSFMDFMGNGNNRFTTSEAAAKNRIQSASKVLYFFNAPPGIKDSDLSKVFADCGVETPAKIKIFPSKSERSSTGLLEWDNKAECVDALVAANHTPIENPNGKHPYILKFCFSDAPIKG